MLYYTTLYYTTLYYIILYYTILYYNMLCYTIDVDGSFADGSFAECPQIPHKIRESPIRSPADTSEILRNHLPTTRKYFVTIFC